jgi:hypothetical protein
MVVDIAALPYMTRNKIEGLVPNYGPESDSKIVVCLMAFLCGRRTSSNRLRTVVHGGGNDESSKGCQHRQDMPCSVSGTS